MRKILFLACVLASFAQSAPPPGIRVNRVQYYLHASEAFLEDGKGEYLRDESGVPLAAKNLARRHIPPFFSVWNKEGAFVFELDRAFSIPLNARVRTEEQFKAVVHVLAQTQIGQAIIRDLMPIEDLTSISTTPYQVLEGPRGLIFRPSNRLISQVDMQSIRDNDTLRGSTPVQIRDGVISFTRDLEVGELVTGLVFASQTDKPAGYQSLRVAMEGIDNNASRDFESDRINLLAKSVKPITKVKEEKLFELVNDLFEGFRNIAINEKQYREDRLVTILHGAHQAMHGFVRELMDSDQQNERYIRSYFQHREDNQSLRGILRALSPYEIRQGYRIDSAVTLSEREIKTARKRCQDWLLQVRPSGADLLDPDVQSAISSFDDQNDVNR